VSNVNPEPRTVDEQMDRPICGKSAKAYVTELLEPPGQRRVIGDREIHLKQLGQRPEEALGLPERKVEDHADRQSRLDGDVRVGTLASGFATGRGPPGVESVIGQPDCEVTTAA